MPRSFVDLPVSVDRGAGTALAVQLGDRLRDAMRGGTLTSGERLPSTRALARRLAVSRTVVTEAYQQLYAEGWLEGRHGSGTYVADMALPPEGEKGRREPASVPVPLTVPVNGYGNGHGPGVIDLRPGQPWVHDYDRAAWRRAWRGAADLPPASDPDPRGLPRLRAALADHLRRTRAIPVGPENVMVTRGTGNGLDLVAATLLRPGDRAGVEEPGYRVARNVFAGRGAEIVPCPVDEDGVVVDGLPDDLRVLYTTPAHQYPLGGRLPIPRRERLLAWARRTGAIVVEDDYDAEFRYDVAPLPALHGLDPGQVVLLGSLSKALTPDIGVGWLVARPSFVEALAVTRDALADRTGGPAQQAVAVLLEKGDLDRHLRRMRLEYARRRAVVVDILGSRVTGDTAGLHVMVELPEHAVAPLVEAARARGVLLDSMARHYHGPRLRHGLVIGYGSASRADVRRGVSVVAELIG
ncbi:MocR-like pyridoxine biosynthesis transcription factor PdxR [Streptosporangium sp. NBC_01469]|uniref:MocR-like pyridoxine biosynthesis transcription factor PdxR n=1 Tax=Streptosporangium sp. NBC_01469 TaxID=2903898 RepID=UPI002E2B63D9|nr:PLP-dependent aminotransferase family protein [Streptosporangium sp. NBC_01469]